MEKEETVTEISKSRSRGEGLINYNVTPFCVVATILQCLKLPMLEAATITSVATNSKLI